MVRVRERSWKLAFPAPEPPAPPIVPDCDAPQDHANAGDDPNGDVTVQHGESFGAAHVPVVVINPRTTSAVPKRLVVFTSAPSLCGIVKGRCRGHRLQPLAGRRLSRQRA